VALEPGIFSARRHAVSFAGRGASDAPAVAGVSRDVQEGDFISFTPSGATGANIPATFHAVIRK